MNVPKHELDLEHEMIQQPVKEAIKVGLESPLRTPILEAIAEAQREAEPPEQIQPMDDDVDEKSRRTKVIQGIGVFLVMFTVLYVTLRWMTAEDE